VHLILLLLLSLNTSLHASDSDFPKEGWTPSDTEILKALNLEAPAFKKINATALSGNRTATLSLYLDYRRHHSPAKWRVMPIDEPARVNSPARVDSQAVLATADLIVDHRLKPINNLDSLPALVDMGKDFNWSYNPLPASDPHFTDEWTYCSVSRTPFWEPLADAYWKTHDEKYAKAWVDQLLDFIQKNSVPSGKEGMFSNAAVGKPSLWRSLDAAIRMNDSWPYAYFHFLNSSSFTPEAQWAYLKMIYQHGLRLRLGLDDAHRTGNWVTAELFGLYTLAVLFPELREATEWRKFAMDRLSKEMDRMVPPDGFEVELTPGYHTVTIDEFQGPFELARLNNEPVPEAMRERILSMYRALVTVMAQNGYDVSTNDSWDINAIEWAKKGLKLAKDPLLLWAVSGGKEGIAPPDSTMLPYAGFYAMRSGWKPEDFFLFFRAGPSGIGHQHEDMLEIVLRAWNQNLLIDPGTYTYDHSEERRYILGTSSHNTVIVDGKGQHRGGSQPHPEKVSQSWVTTPVFDEVMGTYDSGYQANVYAAQEYAPLNWVGNIDKSVSHTRRVIFLKPFYALILDTLVGSGHHVFDLHFHMDAPQAEIDPETQVAVSTRPDKVNVALYPLERNHLLAEIVQGQKNPLLGWLPNRHRSIPTVRFRKEQETPAMFATFLYPFQNSSDHTPSFHTQPLTVHGDGVWAKTIETEKEKIEIAVEKDGKDRTFSFDSDSLGRIQTQAAGLVIRHPVGEKTVQIGGWGLHSYADTKLEFSLKSSESVVFKETDKEDPAFFNPSTEKIRVMLTRPLAATLDLAPGVWTRGSRRVHN
jgi:hypothetical protein